VDSIILLLLILAVVKFVVFGWLVFAVFQGDIKQYWADRKRKKLPAEPVCMYCQSRWTQPSGETQTRWEDDELVLVTTYECQHCHLPFWRVERVAMGSMRH
jgi:hypothetical protein